MTGGLVSEDQMVTFQPLMVPIAVSFLAGLLITLGLEEMPHPRIPRERKPWRWSWSKRKGPTRAELEPEPEQIAEPPPPAPLQVASDIDLKVFTLACLLRAIGDETPGTAVYLRFQRWCSEQTPPLAAPDPWTFARQFKAVCDRAGIRMRKEGNKVVCVNVRLAA